MIDIGTGQPVTIRDTVGLVRDVIGTPNLAAFGRLPDRPGERDFIADPGPAERHLKWRAQIGLRAGIERTAAWHARRITDGERSTAGARS